MLFSALLREWFVRLALERLVHVHWSTCIHDEWMRNAAGYLGARGEQLLELRAHLEEALPHACLHGFEGLERLFPRVDPKDRHVAAAAAWAARHEWPGRTVTIVTWNLRDFPPRALLAEGVQRQTPDQFLAPLIVAEPRRVARSVRALLASHRTHRPGGEAWLGAMTRNRLPRSRAALEPWLTDGAQLSVGGCVL